MNTLQSKYIKGYEGLYSIREDGAVRSHDRINSYGRLTKGRWLKPWVSSNGYLLIGLSKDGINKTPRLHRLVAEAFIPNPDNLPEVNHLDEDKLNPHKSNLAWCTSQENSEYTNAKYHKLIDPDGKEVIVYNLAKFCRENNLSKGSLSMVIKGQRKMHKGYTC